LRSTSSYEYFTSADENGCPSCHLTFVARRNVYVLPSFETFHERARSGTGSKWRSRRTSPLKISPVTGCICPELEIAGLSGPGSPDATTSVPPNRGLATTALSAAPAAATTASRQTSSTRIRAIGAASYARRATSVSADATYRRAESAAAVFRGSVTNSP